MIAELLSKLRVSFQAKVLIPVVAFLVLLPAITLWVVNRHSRNQLLNEARQSVATAEAVFQNSLRMRLNALLTKYRLMVNEPRFKAVTQLGDPDTLRQYLQGMMEETRGDSDFFLYNTEESLLAGVRVDSTVPLESIEQGSSHAIDQALQGVQNIEATVIENRVYNVISLPVTLNDHVVGALTLGIPVGKEAALELQSLTRTEIVLIANDQAAVSTLRETHYDQALTKFFKEVVGSARSKISPEQRLKPIALNHEHYLALAGTFQTSAPAAPIGYVLLSSYEKARRQMLDAQRMLLLLSLAGIGLSTAVIWGLIRKITEPLRHLRDSAEAVGRGDFSRKVEVEANDECGELAGAFNQMTENLKTSRLQLEATVETLKTTQAQLVQSEKLSAVGEFVAGVTHELNNPLTAVTGFAELLEKSAMDEKPRGYVTHIVKNAQRCRKIVQSLLSFSRQHAPERKLVSVNELVEGVLDLLTYEMRTSNIIITTEFEPGLPQLMLDPHQIQQVFLNILNNARQAIESHHNKGSILVKTHLRPGFVRVIFKDDGPGIPRENLVKIFDPFFTTKPVGKGTGLGLSLSYGIVREHGGSIRAESEPGAGTAFYIDLPIKTGARAGGWEEPPQPAAPAISTEANKSVLVIDDEESILAFVREVLDADGYRVVTVTDGETALRYLAQDRFDLTLCDWKMPGYNGQEVYEKLAALNPEAARRIIFMSGDVISEKFQTFLKSNAKTCLPKPFTLQDLRQAINTTVARN